MKKFSIKEIEEIIKNDVYVHVIEKENKSWGAVTPIEEKLIDPGELLYVLRNKIK